MTLVPCAPLPATISRSYYSPSERVITAPIHDDEALCSKHRQLVQAVLDWQDTRDGGGGVQWGQGGRVMKKEWRFGIGGLCDGNSTWNVNWLCHSNQATGWQMKCVSFTLSLSFSLSPSLVIPSPYIPPTPNTHRHTHTFLSPYSPFTLFLSVSVEKEKGSSCGSAWQQHNQISIQLPRLPILPSRQPGMPCTLTHRPASQLEHCVENLWKIQKVFGGLDRCLIWLQDIV